MEPRSPLVSVVLPTFNRASTLVPAVRSVLSQTFRDLEIVIVDDGSEDDTAEVVRRLEDPRIRYLAHGNNRGASAARNSGIARCRGSFVAFQDSDDEWLPDKLESQLARLDSSTPRKAGAYCAYARVFPDGREQRFPGRTPPSGPGELHRALLRRNFIGTPTLLLERGCIERAGGFDGRLPRFQDWELLIRLTRSNELAYVDRVLVKAYGSNDGITAGHDRQLAEAEKIILETHYRWFEEAGPSLLGYRLWHLAHLLFMCGEMREGRERLRAAMKVEARPSYRLALLLSHSRALYRLAYRMRSLSVAGHHG